MQKDSFTDDENRTFRARERHEIIDKICIRITEGESLRTILKDPDMPCMQSIINWRVADPEIEQKFLLASQAQADTFADQMLDVAKSAKGGTKEDVAAARLEFDVLRYRAGQQSPKKWGINKQQIELSGSIDMRQVPDAELVASIAQRQQQVAEIMQRVGVGADDATICP